MLLDYLVSFDYSNDVISGSGDPVKMRSAYAAQGALSGCKVGFYTAIDDRCHIRGFPEHCDLPVLFVFIAF